MDNVRPRISIPMPLADATVATGAALIAFVIRLDPASAFGAYLPLTLGLALASSVLTPIIFSLLGIYRIYWPYAGWSEVLRTLGASLATTIGSAVLLVPLASRLVLLSIPRSVLALHFLLFIVGIACFRIIERGRHRATKQHLP